MIGLLNYYILKQKYNFIFKTVYNTLIMDLIMICINHFNTKKTKYQTMALFQFTMLLIISIILILVLKN